MKETHSWRSSLFTIMGWYQWRPAHQAAIKEKTQELERPGDAKPALAPVWVKLAKRKRWNACGAEPFTLVECCTFHLFDPLWMCGGPLCGSLNHRRCLVFVFLTPHLHMFQQLQMFQRASLEWLILLGLLAPSPSSAVQAHLPIELFGEGGKRATSSH